MGNYKKHWYWLIGTLLIAFTLLGWGGVEVYRQAPPIPTQFVSSQGDVIITEKDILDGQSAWQTTGGMQLGSVLGHGAYQAPDWTADWLHRELVAYQNIQAKALYNKAFDELSAAEQAGINEQMKQEYRSSAANGTEAVVLSDARIQAIEAVAPYYIDLYGDTPELVGTRESFAMKNNTLPDVTARERLADFFFWTSWIASAERPGTNATFTNNWPHEPLIDNVPTAENIIWSIASVVFLIAGVGFMIWIWAFKNPKKKSFTRQVPIL